MKPHVLNLRFLASHVEVGCSVAMLEGIKPYRGAFDHRRLFLAKGLHLVHNVGFGSFYPYWKTRVTGFRCHFSRADKLRSAAPCPMVMLGS